MDHLLQTYIYAHTRQCTKNNLAQAPRSATLQAHLKQGNQQDRWSPTCCSETGRISRTIHNQSSAQQ